MIKTSRDAVTMKAPMLSPRRRTAMNKDVPTRHGSANRNAGSRRKSTGPSTRWLMKIPNLRATRTTSSGNTRESRITTTKKRSATPRNTSTGTITMRTIGPTLRHPIITSADTRPRSEKFRLSHATTRSVDMRLKLSTTEITIAKTSRTRPRDVTVAVLTTLSPPMIAATSTDTVNTDALSTQRKTNAAGNMKRISLKRSVRSKRSRETQTKSLQSTVNATPG